MGAKDKGVGIVVLVDKRNFGENELSLPAKADIHIAPMVLGQRTAACFRSSLTRCLSLRLSSHSSRRSRHTCRPPAISMITGGAIQLLTPHPKEIGIKDSPDNAASYP